MDDNTYDIEEIEAMLGRRCEFKASDNLRNKVMDEAARISRPRLPRHIIWLSAACAAAILIVLLPPPKDDTGSMEDLAPVAAGQVSDMRPDIGCDVASHEITRPDEPEAVASAMPRPVRRSKPLAVTIPAEEPVAIGENPDTASLELKKPEVSGPMPMMYCVESERLQEAIPVSDILITNPDNMAFTHEELVMIKRQAQLAYIEWMRLKLDIIESIIIDEMYNDDNNTKTKYLTI